ncbi:CGNR zinc finger domain-containing protein [Rathayibacter sp. YIM 133350]|uniref:CGNR zinc finger domain-containing protein n=1 Tax=Rathayibacter sp. YIM 133350 TaxID=3131992 RepID=UPI00307FB9D1
MASASSPISASSDAAAWFDPGSLAMEFAYTGALRLESAALDRADRLGEHAPEQLNEAADLAAWLTARFPDSDGIVHTRHLTDALMLRGAIARLALAATAGAHFDAADVDAVNLFAATPDIPPSLPGGGRRAGRKTTSTNQALSSLAREAIAVFSPDALARVRQCAAEDCSLVYVDTSRAGSRRWCSMQRCGNRSKVRAFRATRARSRAASAAPGQAVPQS